MSDVSAVVGHAEVVAAGAANQHGYIVVRSTTKPLRLRQFTGTSVRYAIVDRLFPRDLTPVAALTEVEPGWSRSDFSGVTSEIRSGLVTTSAGIPQDWVQASAGGYVPPRELFVPAGSFLVAVNESDAAQTSASFVYDEIGG